MKEQERERRARECEKLKINLEGMIKNRIITKICIQEQY